MPASSKEFPWYSGNYRVWIHSETHTWHDKNIQSVEHKVTLTWRYYSEKNNEITATTTIEPLTLRPAQLYVLIHLIT